MNHVVYVLTDKNGKVYIGTTGMNPIRRWNHGNGYRFLPDFWETIQRDGWDSIDKRIVADGLSKDEADVMEQKIIAQYDATNPEKGYNREQGGTGRARIISDTCREKMRLAKLGERHPYYGKHFSEEHKAKLSASNRGQKRSSETCKRIGLAIQKPVEQYTIGGSFIARYESGKVAAEMTGIDASHIGHVCSHKRKTAGGFVWEYA